MSYSIRIHRKSGPPIRLNHVARAGLDKLWPVLVPGGPGFVDFTVGDTRVRLALSDVTSVEHWPMDRAAESSVAALLEPPRKLAA